MRRRRPLPYIPTIVTIAAVGVAAMPSMADAAPADDVAPSQQATPGEDTPPAPADPPETTPPPASPEPTDPPPTTPPDTTPPPPDTTAPEPDPEPEPEPEPEPPVDTTPPDTMPPDTTPPAPAPPETPDAPDVEPPAPTVPTPEPAKPLPDGPLRTIAFPVLGTVQYSNDWGHCRAGCARRHEGTDMIGVRMQPLLAAVDGTITRISHDNMSSTAGSVITVTGADGWYYNYFHVNNDTPGTDDGAAGPEWQVRPNLKVGSAVRAGQVIGYMGDSGNAEGSVPHLHFEIRTPDRTPVNPYPSLVEAQRRETCAPLDGARALAENAAALSPDAVAIIPIDGGGHWLIDRDGRLFAEGPAARVQPVAGIACEPVQALVRAAKPVAERAQPEATTPPATAEAQPLAATRQPAEPQEPAEAYQPAPAPEQSMPSAVEAAAASPAVPTATPEQSMHPEAEVAPASPAVATTEQWTVAPGQSLWHIVQQAYGAADVAATVSLVDTVFDFNRDQLWHPDELEIGMTLQLPSLTNF